jgi:hypothetical protein
MQISVSREEFRKRKLFLATPMYGGQCTGMYTRSVADLTAKCLAEGIELKSYFLFNESLITRARNYCVDMFLQSDFTHLMFIDSDISFDATTVLQLLALAGPDSPYDIIGGAYPKKNISWEKIKMAVDKGVADENPNVLEDFVGDYVFNPAPDTPREVRLDEPAQMLEIGTGFMMIRREVFEKYVAAYPDIMYRPDHARSEDYNGQREIAMYFQAGIDPFGSKRYLSEDYWFCQHVRRMGGKIWLCPWIKLEHTGTYTFGGSLQALAAIGANPTIDPAHIQKKK